MNSFTLFVWCKGLFVIAPPGATSVRGCFVTFRAFTARCRTVLGGWPPRRTRFSFAPGVTAEVKIPPFFNRRDDRT